MRGGSGGLSTVKNKVSGGAVMVMAWISFVLAVVGGAAVTKTWVSTWVVGIFGWAGTWGRVIAAVLLVIGVGLLVRDLSMDWTPNYWALIAAGSLPTVARACSGGLSGWITTHSQNALTWFNQAVGDWMPNAATGWVVAACAFAGMFVLAQRTVPKTYGGR